MGTTTNGVYRLDIDKKELTHPIKKGNITSFYRDSEGELWIGSWEEGLFPVKTDGKIENFRYDARIRTAFLPASHCELVVRTIWAIYG